MSVQLLDKTRKINKLLHNNSSSKVVFNDICKVLTEILLSNVLVISKKGKVLGASAYPGFAEIKELLGGEVGGYLADHMLALGEKVMEYNGFDRDIRYLKNCTYRKEASAVGAAKHFFSEFIKNI